MDYYFYNLFRTEIPDYTFGILCATIAVFVIAKVVDLILGKRNLPTGSDIRYVPIPSDSPKIDRREKISGVWRSKSDNIQYRIYPWGGPYLVETHSLDTPQDCRFYSLHLSTEDEYRFWLEADETLTIVFNEVSDYLYIVEKGILMERISEDKLKEEQELDKIVTKTLKKIKENESN